MPAFRLTRWNSQPSRDLALTRAARWLEIATDIATNTARGRAPVRTGRLRRSIVALNLTGPAGRQSAGVLAAAPFALWVEIGTRYTNAQPYLRPALRTVLRLNRGIIDLARRDRRDSDGGSAGPDPNSGGAA